MAIVDLKGQKTIGDNYGNATSVARVAWDVAVDVNVLIANDNIVLKAEDDIVITGFYFAVETLFVGATATIDLGINGGDEDVLLDGTGVADMTAGALIQPFVVEGTPNVMPLPLKMAAGEELILTVATADFTAGKGEFVFEYVKL